MLTLSLATSLAVAASAYASCSGFSTGSTDTITTNFNLAAYNAATGVITPLNLLIADVVPMTGYHVLSTGTGPSNGWLGFTMAKGELTATPPNEYLTPAIYIGLDAPPSGNEIYPTPAAWPLFCNEISGSIPNEPFCSVPNPSGGDNILALNGYTNLFSICQSSFQQLSTPALVFNASSTAVRDNVNTYDGSSCVPVTVLVVPGPSTM